MTSQTLEPATDLGVLSRANAGAQRRPSTVPRPPSRWRTRLLVPGLILAAAAALLLYAGRRALMPATPVQVVPVVAKADASAAAAPASGATLVAQAAGWIEADPYAVNVSALTDGVVEEVLVLEGQRVEAGQVVARLVDDDARLAVARAEAELRGQEAALAAAKAALTAAQREWDNPIARTRAVATAQAMLAESRAALARHPSEVAAEQGRLEELQEELRRTEETLARRSATEYEVTQARLRVRTQQAVVEAAKAREPILQAQIRLHEAELAAAEENLRLRIEETRALEEAKANAAAAEAGVSRAAAALEEARLRLDRTQVRSPVAGTVMARLAEPGAKLMLAMDDPRSAHAVRLYDPAKLQVRVDVPLADAAKVGVGQPAQITVEVLPDRIFRGVVTRVVHEADIQKNTLQVKVAIEDPAEQLKPEMLARVRFLGRAAAETGSTAGGTAAQRVFAPVAALALDGPAAPGATGHAWIVDRTRDAAARRSVRLAGSPADGWVAVAEGLNPGDLVIAPPPAGLGEGDPVIIAGERTAGGGD